MRSTANVEGHPIHPILVGFPVAYLLGSACIDVCAHATRASNWFRTARHMNALGITAALAAAVPGVIDYVLAVPPKSSAKRRATDHMFANLAGLSLFFLSRYGRDEGEDRPARWAVAAELFGATLMGVAGWLGGTLVYRNQIGVDHRYANAGKWALEARSPVGDEVDVGSVEDLGVDQMKLIRLGSQRIVLARTEQGYVAFDDRCTHRGGPLSDGALVCGTVQCPWHGSQFDVSTGVVKNGPARKPIATRTIGERDGRLRLRVTDWARQISDTTSSSTES